MGRWPSGRGEVGQGCVLAVSQFTGRLRKLVLQPLPHSVPFYLLSSRVGFFPADPVKTPLGCDSLCPVLPSNAHQSTFRFQTFVEMSCMRTTSFLFIVVGLDLKKKNSFIII